MARQTKFQCNGKIDPLGVLQIQKTRNPRAYQLAIILPSGKSFVSSTPERLYVRSGTDICTEAVAGTRGRGPQGDLKKDFFLSMDLLQNPKDHVEFCAVRDWVRDSLESISEKNTVIIEREKSIIKQATVQHLYGCLSGKIKNQISDKNILEVLHPTPAVCGRPQNLALKEIVQIENFDRGFYAGPIGWVSGSAAEFAVAIRSSLFTPKKIANGKNYQKIEYFDEIQQKFQTFEQFQDSTEVIMYSGVGVVKGSNAELEWNELNLKILQYQKILLPPFSVFQRPNINLVWTHLLFEEFARQGVDTVCIAPGSRSSALVLAAASNPLLRIVTCIDERSLGFWALGYGKASKRPAVVITSSGTAVANLLPAVVEASQSNVPMIICTADRPLELRDTGANQTINQVGIYGKYVRYECDLDAPSVSVPARFVLTTAGTAYGHSVGNQAGPVHLNCQFREPLSPQVTQWDKDGEFMRGIQKWEKSQQPFVDITRNHRNETDSFNEQLQRKLEETERGLIVVGELRDDKDVNSVVKLSQNLQWAIVADVLSGIRIGAQSCSTEDSPNIYHMDQILVDKDNWQKLQPTTILFIGDHLVSKRVQQFMEWCALDSPSQTEIIQIKKTSKRNDPAHIISQCTIGTDIPEFKRIQQLSNTQQQYNKILNIVNSHVARCIQYQLQQTDKMSEPHVAHMLAQTLPSHHALFLGNSMPIRDMDMFAQPRNIIFLQNSQNNKKFSNLQEQIDEKNLSGKENFQNNQSQLNFQNKFQSNQEINGKKTGQQVFSREDDNLTYLLDVESNLKDDNNNNNDNFEDDVQMYDADDISDGNQNNGSQLYYENIQIQNSKSITQNHENLISFQKFDDDESFINKITENNTKNYKNSKNLENFNDNETFTNQFNINNTEQLQNFDIIKNFDNKKNIGVPIGSNRGASGIDGVISTAVGFSSGQDRPTTLVIGDVSFLHDTNGLMFLSSSSSDSTVRCPVTVVVINNKGGGIFEFLPLAKTISKEQLEYLWTTPQNADIGTLCQAHGVLHACVQNIKQFKQALEAGWQSNQHNVIEVVTDRTQNHEFHMELNSLSKQATQRALNFCYGSQTGLLTDLKINQFKLPLKKQLTTDSNSKFREGLIVHVNLRFEDGVGVQGEGEVSPLPNLHKESLTECRGQIGALKELLNNTEIPNQVLLLDGSFRDFWWQFVGIRPEALYPSVRFGVEMAIQDAMKQYVNRNKDEVLEVVKLNGLIGNCGIDEAVLQAQQIVQSGEQCIKIKVGCRSNPIEDVQVIGAIRNAVGPNIVLRADANRRFNLQQAITFGHSVYEHNLQYIEEPTNDPAQFQNFYLTTGVHYAIDETLDNIIKNNNNIQNYNNNYNNKPYAIDETLDNIINNNSNNNDIQPYTIDEALDNNNKNNIQNNNNNNSNIQLFNLLQNGINQMGMGDGLKAVIVKPMLIGSADDVIEISKWAKNLNCLTIISSCFETEIRIDYLKFLARQIDKIYDEKQFHGLGTLNWYESDALKNFERNEQYTKNFESAQFVSFDFLSKKIFEQNIDNYNTTSKYCNSNNNNSMSTNLDCNNNLNNTINTKLDCKNNNNNYTISTNFDNDIDKKPNFQQNFNRLKMVQLIGQIDKPAIIFLHGMFGNAEDWMPIMRNIHEATNQTCIAIDFNSNDQLCSIQEKAEAIKNCVKYLKQKFQGGIGVVGYSMGGRELFNLLVKNPNLFNFGIFISSSPGIQDQNQRERRLQIDLQRSQILQRYGSLQQFLDQFFFQGEIWGEIKNNPRYKKFLEKRGVGKNIDYFFRVFELASPGITENFWDQLDKINIPVLFVAGKKDEKYCQIAQKLKENLKNIAVVEIEDCGHAVQFEKPIELSQIILNFLR